MKAREKKTLHINIQETFLHIPAKILNIKNIVDTMLFKIQEKVIFSC